MQQTEVVIWENTPDTFILHMGKTGLQDDSAQTLEIDNSYAIQDHRNLGIKGLGSCTSD